MTPIDFGKAQDIEAVERLASPLAGRRFVDIGCGKGDLARALVARGAKVLGVEPDPNQAAAHRDAAPVRDLTFAEATAEALPLKDGAVDGAIFGRSLHHVPTGTMARALAEAIRVLDPDQGVLVVLEPTLDGAYSRVMQPFHDETAVRNAAQAALAEHATPRFARRETYVFHTVFRYDDFGAFVDEVAGSTFNPFRRADVDTPTVRALFEANRAGDHFLVRDDTRVDVFRGPKGRV